MIIRLGELLCVLTYREILSCCLVSVCKAEVVVLVVEYAKGFVCEVTSALQMQTEAVDGSSGPNVTDKS